MAEQKKEYHVFRIHGSTNVIIPYSKILGTDWDTSSWEVQAMWRHKKFKTMNVVINNT